MSLALLSGLLPPATARADGPESAYGKGATDASLDPGEERMTADEENKSRLKDLSDAYHSGYTARAKEDAETYSSLRDQLKHPPKPISAQLMPPLPEGMPGDDEARVATVARPQIAQRALPPAQPQPQYRQPYQQAQYAPPPQAVAYQQAPEYAEAPPAYAQVQEAYAQPEYAEEEAYAPPPRAAQPVQYVPVYSQPAYVPQPPAQAMVQPVIMVARPPAYAGYRRAYWARPYRRAAAVRYGYAVQPTDYRDWQ